MLNVLSQLFLKMNNALPENIVLMYSKIFFIIRNSSFQENAKTKVYALDDFVVYLGIVMQHSCQNMCTFWKVLEICNP